MSLSYGLVRIVSLMRVTLDGKAYQRYMRSSSWAVRRKAKVAAVGMCEGCGSRIGLQVHHRTYERLGREKDSDLVVFCDTCHTGVHHLVQSGMSLKQATDKVIFSRPALDTRKPVDFVPVHRRPGYKTPHLGGRSGRMYGIPVGSRSPQAEDSSGRDPKTGDFENAIPAVSPAGFEVSGSQLPSLP